MKASTHPSYIGPSFGGRDFSRAHDGYSRLRRLARMPLAEIAGRSRQEAAKILERLTTTERPIDPATILREHAPAFVSDQAALQILREAAPKRFFAGVENLQFAAQAVPEHRDAVLNSANVTRQNRFDLLGYRNLWFGDPI